MEDLKLLMQHNYIKYASYVILDRAIPDVVDGLKPVQRRILHTLWTMHDGKLHKVANVVGQTMAFHPHGDIPIKDALVNLANKGFFLDQQGNFGNTFTGDPPAASRYIETRLSPLAKETLFNPDLTETISSYDSRNQEPVSLPAKIPVVLMQGTSGIAVGMSTQIFPHNFVELLEAEIAILEGKTFEILPDFFTGGTMDASEYNKGKGKVKLRARIEVPDPKTLVITEICYGTTTESLMRSIEEAARRGKIKIDAINDYTADRVEIEIKLPRSQYAEELIQALYAYTECEVALNSFPVVIRDNFPWEANVDEILTYHVHLLKGYLEKELDIERGRILEKIFDKTLEQIFIENRLYQNIENIGTFDQIHRTVEKSLIPFHQHLTRVPAQEDREKLLAIPIRRISRFDLEKNQKDIVALEKRLKQVERDLKNIKHYTINYLRELIDKYGKESPRKTAIQTIEKLDIRSISTRQLTVGYDLKTGFIGTKVSGKETLTCTNYDKLLMMYDDGTYRIVNIPEKQYMHQGNSQSVYIGIADKETIFSAVYKDPNTHQCFAKRFAVKKYIIDKEYCYIEQGMKLELLTVEPEVLVELHFIPKVKQKIAKTRFSFQQVLIKGVSAKGIKMTNRAVKKVKVVKNGR
ncbi:MAG: DNA topoisomerase IV subunit A [Waddliaceae bacterium]